MPVELYTQADVDALLAQQAASSYTQDQVDAFLTDIRNQIAGITPQPQVPTGKILGSGDMSAFRGLKISGHRTYNGFGAQRQYNPSASLVQVKADLAAGRKSYFSIGNGNNKAHPGGPQDWARALTGLPVDSFVPTVKVVLLTGGVLIVHHEPEDDPGSSDSFKVWFGLMSDYYRAAVPGIRIGLCLMSWTGRPGGPGFPKWTPDPKKWDIFCIDGYAHQVSDSATNIFGSALAYARSLKKPLMITETGQENNVDQVPFLASLQQFVLGNSDVEGAIYWNGGNGVQSNGGHNYHLEPGALSYYQHMLETGSFALARSAV